MTKPEIEEAESEELQEIEGIETPTKHAVYPSKITQNKSHFLVRIPKQVRETFNITAGDYIVFKLDLTKEKPTLGDLEIYVTKEKPESHKKSATIPDEVVD